MDTVSSLAQTPILRMADGLRHAVDDVLAVEEPLEIRVSFESNSKRIHKAVSITMRTPGDDAELAAGFLFTEGIIKNKDQVLDVRHCGRPSPQTGLKNTIVVELAAGTGVDFKRLERNFYTTSSCGVCGKSSIEALHTGAKKLNGNGPLVSPEIIRSLPERLRTRQEAFDRTGGLHASGLFATSGELDLLREDVGRHNALDKVIGRKFLTGDVPMNDKILLVSGRASFELVQKAVMAGIPILAAVGAPSSLAVELAREMNMTLIGFLRKQMFNIYTGSERVSQTGWFSGQTEN